MAPEDRFWLFLTERSERTWNHLQKSLERMIEMTQPRFTAQNVILGYGLNEMFILIFWIFLFPLITKTTFAMYNYWYYFTDDLFLPWKFPEIWQTAYFSSRKQTPLFTSAESCEAPLRRDVKMPSNSTSTPSCLRKAFWMNKAHPKFEKPHSFKHDTHGVDIPTSFLSFILQECRHSCRLLTIFPSVAAILPHQKGLFSYPMLARVCVFLGGNNTAY